MMSKPAPLGTPFGYFQTDLNAKIVAELDFIPVQWLHTIRLSLCSYCTIILAAGSMASIDAPLSNCKIYIYPGDHNPPHFHLRGPNSRALIDIVTLDVLAGKASRTDLAEVKAWAAKPENLTLLVAEWNRLNERE